MRSTRSSSRARTESQRGFALISAIVLAVLYFALMELMMIDAARALNEAQRYRSKVIAFTLAESAAELAARQLLASPGANVNYQDPQGSLHGELQKHPDGTFEITGESKTTGVPTSNGSCFVQGHIAGTEVHIDYSSSTQ